VLTCATTSISVTATGGVSYAWSGTLGNAAAATITAPGTYTVTVTGANGCTSTASITITQNVTAPTAGITSATTVLTCTTTSISLTATGGGTYAWSNGLGSGATKSITAPGTYTVTVTGSNGCSSTASITITQNTTAPAAGITSATTVLTCATTSISLTATGGGTYAWSNGLGSGATKSITAPGTYTVTVTGSNGCTATASITITQVLPQITSTTGSNGTISPLGTTTVACGGRQQYTITPDPCYHIATVFVDGVEDVAAELSGTYSFNNVTANHTIDVTFALSGPYTITASSDANGSITPAGVTSLACGAGQCYTMTANAGFHLQTVLIDGVNNPAAVSAGSYCFSNVMMNHTIAVTFSSNCTPTTLTVSASGANDFCGSTTLTATPAVPGAYSYVWKYGATVVGTSQTLTLTNASPDGVYTVTASISTCVTPPASYTYSKQGSLQSYTILATDNVDLGESNTINGSAGNTKRDGQIHMKKNASVPAPGFVKASRIMIDNPSNVPNRILGQVMVTLPTMQYATTQSGLRNITVAAGVTLTLNGNYNDVTIKKNANVTLTGSIFHNVNIEDGAKVNFTGSVLNMAKLTVGNSDAGGPTPTRVIFATDCSVRVKDNVEIKGNAQINPTAKQVTFYVDGDFNVNGKFAWVYANVYAPDHEINVKGDDNKTTYMVGRFIAKQVESGDHVNWSSFNCANPPATPFAPETAPTQFTSVPPMEVRAYPNPSENGFNLMLRNQGTDEVTVRIMDLTGKVMKSFKGTYDQLFHVGDELKPGMYIAEVIQGTQKAIVKLVKQQ
jgi:hypothetical protein